jgi:hypothetical protein
MQIFARYTKFGYRFIVAYILCVVTNTRILDIIEKRIQKYHLTVELDIKNVNIQDTCI